MKLMARTAVLTGAASGIGAATALALAHKGCHLALVDINAEQLQLIAAQARAIGVKVSEHVLDVADRDAVAALPQAVLAEHGRVELLFNIAGVALGGDFSRISAPDFDWLMEINFHGPVRLTRAFLPVLSLADEARIVNMSSVYGLISPPRQTAYSASKFALRAFSNALHHELIEAHSRVGVSVVHPGGIATQIAHNARVPVDYSTEEVEQTQRAARKFLRMPPAKAAGILLRGIERKQSRILIGADAHLATWLERLAPVNYWAWIGRKALK